MYDHLKEHAIKNVWCSPEQDNQIILAAQRITRPEGELVSFPIMTRRLALPTQDRRYHVFQIGQAHPGLMGLLPRTPSWTVANWTKFSDTVDLLPLFCDIYTDTGVHIPLHRSYYMYTNDRALIFAVEYSDKIPMDYENDRVYLRLYTNAYYGSDEVDVLTHLTKCDGGTIFGNADIMAFQTAIAPYRTLPGYVYCYVNGHLVKNIDFFTTKTNDIVEYIYDASVKQVVDLRVGDLPTFSSILDNQYKYLVHYPQVGQPQIDYIDDVDVYLIKKTGEQFSGRFYHRNLEEAFRMVTHHDYSLLVNHVTYIGQELIGDIDPEPSLVHDLYVRILVRHSGLMRPLIYDNQRLFELYKLSEENIVAALVGLDSVMPQWSAPVLEASAYTEMMRVPQKNIDIDLIERAYGYNSISKILGESPIYTQAYGELQAATLPPGLHEAATIYEYDITGTLLEFNAHHMSAVYLAKHPFTRIVEGVVGLGSHRPSVIEGSDALPVSSKYGYRVYRCHLVNGLPNNRWVDITGNGDYTVIDDVLYWSSLETDVWLQVRTDERFLTYEIDLIAIAGTFYFDLSEMIGTEHRLMAIPMGDLDLWLNGKSLIKGLDYFVQFPRVYIVNKSHLIQPAGSTPQKITVRFTGFADRQLRMKPIEDYGFIEHGVLSNNDRFDVRDDKVLRITVRGELKERSMLTFSEQHAGVSIVNAANGSPYQVKDVVVPLRNLSEEETYQLREVSLVIDQETEDYMTLKLPQPLREAVSAIPNRYQLVSPFFSHLVNDIQSGQFDKLALERVLSDNDVMALCQPYEHLLAFDPINEIHNVDQRYVVIHPTQLQTTIGLSLYAYRFIQKVTALYGRGLITLSPHLNVSLGG